MDKLGSELYEDSEGLDCPQAFLDIVWIKQSFLQFKLTKFCLHSISLIAATSTMRFVQFRFGTTYLEYLDADNVATQK